VNPVRKDYRRWPYVIVCLYIGKASVLERLSVEGVILDRPVKTCNKSMGPTFQLLDAVWSSPVTVCTNTGIIKYESSPMLISYLCYFDIFIRLVLRVSSYFIVNSCGDLFSPSLRQVFLCFESRLVSCAR
jgi:hypothetical protein